MCFKIKHIGGGRGKPCMLNWGSRLKKVGNHHLEANVNYSCLYFTDIYKFVFYNVRFLYSDAFNDK